MTPLEIAKQECANYREGACQGIIIRDDGSLAHDPDMPARCVFLTGSGRCRYFEECLLPMETRKEWPGIPAVAARHAAEFAEGCRQYRLANNISRGQRRPCPKCGRPLEPRMRLCPMCRVEAEKESRKRWRQKAGSDVES